jgi:hypothetical protein
MDSAQLTRTALVVHNSLPDTVNVQFADNGHAVSRAIDCVLSVEMRKIP